MNGKGTTLDASLDEDELADPLSDDLGRIVRLLDHMERCVALVQVTET